VALATTIGERSRRTMPGEMRLDRQFASKVPAITAGFWVTKVLTTAMGESISDYSVHRFDPVLAVAAAFVAFLIALAWQLALSRYHAVAYWLAVSMVAVFGTMAADVTHVKFKVPYAVSTAVFAVVLGVVFTAWQSVEHTLSIHSITSTRRELFYWATVLATFALGTAAGDLLAIAIGTGFFWAGVVFIGIICVPLLGWRLLGWNPIASFWFAYIVTRPIGASYADWFGKPTSVGGLGLGDGVVGGTLAALVACLVAYFWIADRRPGAPRVAGSAQPQ
jgi:uncharacterized membrane-anchored protein